MSSKFIFLSPGQGNQYPGMLSKWLYPTKDPGFQNLDGEKQEFAQQITQIFNAVVAAASEDLQVDLAALGSDFELPKTTLAQSQNGQSVLTLCAIFSAWAHLSWKKGEIVGDFSQLSENIALCAGHSAGQISAGALAGFFTPLQAVKISYWRGQVMQKALTAAKPSGMKVALWRRGTFPFAPENTPNSDAEIYAQLEAWAKAHNLCLANFNLPNQAVFSGFKTDIEKIPTLTGLRWSDLPVSGAFHSFVLTAAAESYRPYLQKVSVCTAQARYLSNFSGLPLSSGENWQASWETEILRGFTQPVNWVAIMKGAQDYYRTQQNIENLEICITDLGKALANMWKKTSSVPAKLLDSWAAALV